MSQIPWQDRAAEKVARTAAKIPSKWRISLEDRDRAREARNLTGAFIHSFLSEDEAEIVRLDSVTLVQKIASSSLSSLEVANAFCKTAAVAHQIVGLSHD